VVVFFATFALGDLGDFGDLAFLGDTFLGLATLLALGLEVVLVVLVGAFLATFLTSLGDGAFLTTFLGEDEVDEVEEDEGAFFLEPAVEALVLVDFLTTFLVDEEEDGALVELWVDGAFLDLDEELFFFFLLLSGFVVGVASRFFFDVGVFFGSFASFTLGRSGRFNVSCVLLSRSTIGTILNCTMVATRVVLV